MALIEVEYGYGNSAKGGRNLPLNIRLTNDSGEDLQGSLEVLTRQSDNEIYAYDFPVQLTAGEISESELTVPLGVGSDQLAVRVLDTAGTVAAVKRVKLNISTAPPEIFIGLLSDDPAELQYFDGASVNYGQLRTRAFTLDPEQFPTDRARLDTLDVIVASRFRMSELTVEQTRALMQWMREGGVLIFGTGERVNDTLGVFAPEFLDDMYESPVMTELSFSGFQTPGAPGGADVTLPLVNISLHGGSTVFSADNIPVISAANKGTGILAVSSFDLADISGYAREHSSFTDSMLTSILGQSRLERLASEAYGTEYSEYWSAQSLIDAGTMTELPDVTVFGGLLLFYLVLCGPVLWLLLKRIDRTILFRKCAAALSLVFAGVLYAAGIPTRLENTFCTYARVRESGENTINETTYLNLRNPYTGSYSVEIPDRYTVIPLTTALNLGKMDTVTGSEKENVRISGAEGKKKISVETTGAFQPRFFRLERSGANQDNEGFAGNLFLLGDECSGVIRNQFPCTIRNAAVCLYGKVIPIGTMEAGEEVDISDRVIYNIPLNDYDTVAAFLTGVYDGSLPLSEHIGSLEQANFLGFYLSSATGDYSADAKIIGFADDTGGGELVSEDLKRSGMTLVTSMVPVDMREGGTLCRSLLFRTPEVISGDYIAETNSFYRGDPVVLSYLAGSDIRISELYFEEIDPVFENTGETGETQNFRGTISLYNYSTGNFDDLDPEHLRLQDEELSGYLSPDNMLTVRYVESQDVIGGRLDTALPVPYVIGEEN